MNFRGELGETDGSKGKSEWADTCKVRNDIKNRDQRYQDSFVLGG